MKEIEAMNMMLRAIGSRAVNDVDTTHPDAANARDTMDRVRRMYQVKTWWFNVDYGITFEPDNTGKIKLPKNVSTLEIRDPRNFNRGFNPHLDIVRKGDYLYNKKDKTYTFEAGVHYDVVHLILDWADMPETFQYFCAYEAGVMFIDDQLEDTRKMQSMSIRAMKAKKELMTQHLREMQYNVFHQPSTANALAGQQPYLRGNRHAR